jgi:DNA-binding winged helix-turn-helix (wHTH) protein
MVTNTSVFAFHQFRLDPAQRSLSRDGRLVTLTPKEFDTLLALVEAGGRVVDKEELLDCIWPDSYVGDGSLARNISVLRKVLGEEVIETHRGRGYRISLPVAVTDRAADALTVEREATHAPAPAVRPVAPNHWLKGKGRLVWGIVAILVFSFSAFHFFVVKSAKAHPSANVIPIHSILIQKEGAIDPLDEGFKLYVADETPSPHAIYNRETNGWDRWRFVSTNQNNYYHPLSDEEKNFALQRDWKLTCVCALENGEADANVDFAGKGPRFDMGLLQEGDRYFVGLTSQISPTSELYEKIEFPGVADVAHPHTYQLRYDHVSKAASLWIDGKLRASGYQGHHQFQENSGLFFGVAIYGNATKGSAVFREVRFEAN